jgi:hypothetical protein
MVTIFHEKAAGGVKSRIFDHRDAWIGVANAVLVGKAWPGAHFHARM